jgi:hypothetical protein
MTFTIDTDASREEWDAFLAAVEADAVGREPDTTTDPGAAPSPPADEELVELLSQVWGFQVGVLRRP